MSFHAWMRWIGTQLGVVRVRARQRVRSTEADEALRRRIEEYQRRRLL